MRFNNVIASVILLFAFFVESAQAKIVFDWSHTKVLSVDKRQDAEARFDKAAGEYLNLKYANLGPYDFVNSPERLRVVIFDGYEKENGAKAEYFPGFDRISDQVFSEMFSEVEFVFTDTEAGIIFADPSFFDNLNVFQIGAFHELCHAYDYTMTDRMKRDPQFFIKTRKLLGINTARMGEWYHEYLVHNEKRAFMKEEEYINDLRPQLSDEDYDLAMDHVQWGKSVYGIEKTEQ